MAAPRHASWAQQQENHKQNSTTYISGRARAYSQQDTVRASQQCMKASLQPASSPSTQESRVQPFQECHITTGYGYLRNYRLQGPLGHWSATSLSNRKTQLKDTSHSSGRAYANQPLKTAMNFSTPQYMPSTERSIHYTTRQASGNLNPQEHTVSSIQHLMGKKISSYMKQGFEFSTHTRVRRERYELFVCSFVRSPGAGNSCRGPEPAVLWLLLTKPVTIGDWIHQLKRT